MKKKGGSTWRDLPNNGRATYDAAGRGGSGTTPANETAKPPQGRGRGERDAPTPANETARPKPGDNRIARGPLKPPVPGSMVGGTESTRTTGSNPTAKKSGSGGGSSLKQKALDILGAQHKQNLADINTRLTGDIKSMMQNHSNQAARTGMNWASLEGTMNKEQESDLRKDAARSANLENINYSQGILSILQKYAGSGRKAPAAAAPTTIPTRTSPTATPAAPGSTTTSGSRGTSDPAGNGPQPPPVSNPYYAQLDRAYRSKKKTGTKPTQQMV